ncbi:MAG: inositol monophosphatase [Deltaproteobacteria bacterium]|nr:MAG: inositol monophosphatase [Deltaproteobacteria bacterium]
MELKTIKRVAISAAYRGAGVLNTHLGRLPDVQKKDDIDLVTEADVQSEAVIIETIRNAFPDHTILAEEGGLKKGVTEYLWLIDPLDGTTNFAHQLNVFSISIAFCLRGDIAVGIVLTPVLGELFTAIKGNGAFLNGRPIHVSSTRSVADSLLATGFPYNIRDLLDPITKRFMNCLKSSQGIRRIGSAAIDLCYVACGRFDGFWEQNLKPWDTAAGMLVAKEAGAVVSDFANQRFAPDNHEILATNGHIHREMISLLKIENAQKGFP